MYDYSSNHVSITRQSESNPALQGSLPRLPSHQLKVNPPIQPLVIGNYLAVPLSKASLASPARALAGRRAPNATLRHLAPVVEAVQRHVAYCQRLSRALTKK